MVEHYYYECVFEFFGHLGDVIRVESDEGIAPFKDGFWVDVNLKYTKTGNAKYWIPPSKIRYIAKRERP